jgi:hypothetical protein
VTHGSEANNNSSSSGSTSTSTSYRTSKSRFAGLEEIAPIEVTADDSSSSGVDLVPMGPGSNTSSSSSNGKDGSMTSGELLQMFMADAVLNAAEAEKLEQQLIQQQLQLERQIKLQAGAKVPGHPDHSTVQIPGIPNTELTSLDDNGKATGLSGIEAVREGGVDGGSGGGSGSKGLVPPGSSSPLPTLEYQLTPKALVVGLLVGIGFALLMQRLALVVGVVPGYQVHRGGGGGGG